MKWFVAILLLALVAIAMAVEKTPEIETAKQPQVASGVRDKRGYYSSHAYDAYPLYAYNSLPYAYSPYSYYRYPSHYPYYDNHYPYYY